MIKSTRLPVCTRQTDQSDARVFFILPIFLQLVRVGGQNKNKNKFHSDHFPIEIKLKTQLLN